MLPKQAEKTSEPPVRDTAQRQAEPSALARLLVSGQEVGQAEANRAQPQADCEAEEVAAMAHGRADRLLRPFINLLSVVWFHGRVNIHLSPRRSHVAAGYAHLLLVAASRRWARLGADRVRSDIPSRSVVRPEVRRRLGSHEPSVQEAGVDLEQSA